MKPTARSFCAALSAILCCGLLSAFALMGVHGDKPRDPAPPLTLIPVAGADDTAAEEPAGKAGPASPRQAAEMSVPAPAAPPPVPVELRTAPPETRPIAAAEPAFPAAVNPGSRMPDAPGPAAKVAEPVAAGPQPAAAGGMETDRAKGGGYAARIRSWLLAHKIYPRGARMRRQEGVVQVRFVLDRRGGLIEGRIVGSSGSELLDREGLAMLARAVPYPAAPDEVRGDRIEFTAAIEFQLRG